LQPESRLVSYTVLVEDSGYQAYCSSTMFFVLDVE
jgi:hypothetical protein